jgi:hypothetical protein
MPARNIWPWVPERPLAGHCNAPGGVWRQARLKPDTFLRSGYPISSLLAVTKV